MMFLTKTFKFNYLILIITMKYNFFFLKDLNRMRRPKPSQFAQLNRESLPHSWWAKADRILNPSFGPRPFETQEYPIQHISLLIFPPRKKKKKSKWLKTFSQKKKKKKKKGKYIWVIFSCCCCCWEEHWKGVSEKENKWRMQRQHQQYAISAATQATSCVTTPPSPPPPLQSLIRNPQNIFPLSRPQAPA